MPINHTDTFSSQSRKLALTTVCRVYHCLKHLCCRISNKRWLVPSRDIKQHYEMVLYDSHYLTVRGLQGVSFAGELSEMFGNARLLMSTRGSLMDIETKISLDNFSSEAQFSCKTRLQVNCFIIFSRPGYSPRCFVILFVSWYLRFLVEERVLTKIFRFKREEERGRWRKCHIEDFHD